MPRVLHEPVHAWVWLKQRLHSRGPVSSLQRAEERQSMWLSVDTEARGSAPQGSVWPQVCDGGGSSGTASAQSIKTGHPALWNKGLAWKGASETPGKQRRGDKMVQGLSIEFLDFAATLWTDFRTTGLWFPLARDVHPIPGLRRDLSKT